MLRKVLVIYGGGSLGLETLLLLKKNVYTKFRYKKIYFIDDYSNEKYLLEVRVLNRQEFLKFEFKTFEFIIAIALPEVRKNLASFLEDIGGSPINVVAKNLYSLDEFKIGKGNIIFPGCALSSNIEISNYNILNANSYIGHDCKIANFTTISPGVTICGNVNIEDGVFVGAGAVVINGSERQKINLSAKAFLGIGSVVLSNVATADTVVGNPAKKIL